MHPRFETSRLSLRPISVSDAALLFELDSDPEVMRYLSGGQATPLDVIEREILPRFLGYATRAPWAGVWVATERSSGEFIGWFSLRPPKDVARGAELGYRLRKSAWGKGYATEGSRALIDRAFIGHGLERVFAATYEHNTGSRRVMEKLGMRHIRSYRFNEADSAGEPTFAPGNADAWDGDEVEYELTREDWAAPA